LQQGLHRLHQDDHPNTVSRRIPALANDKTGQQIEQQLRKIGKDISGEHLEASSSWSNHEIGFWIQKP